MREAKVSSVPSSRLKKVQPLPQFKLGQPTAQLQKAGSKSTVEPQRSKTRPSSTVAEPQPQFRGS